MLLLAEPFGYRFQPPGIHIRITCDEPNRARADRLSKMTVQYGCPPEIVLKVADCLYASGIYECYVRTQLHFLEQLGDEMSAEGGDLIILDFDERNRYRSIFY